jgi:hypothetical protein
VFAVGINDHLLDDVDDTNCMDGSVAKPRTSSSSVAVVNCNICSTEILPLLPPPASLQYLENAA